MENIILDVVPRKREEKAPLLRKAGKVPGVLYGYQTENQMIACEYKVFHKTYIAAGESTVIDLHIGGKSIPVLIHALEVDPVTGQYAHVDFYALNMKKKITAHIPLRVIGEAPAVKELGGILIHNRDSLTVTCFPKDLPPHIDVEMSSLTAFGSSITVGDLKLPPNVEVAQAAQEILISIQEPRAEEVKPVETVVEGAPAADAAAADAKKKEEEEKEEE